MKRQKNTDLIYIETKYSSFKRGKEIGNHFKNVIHEGFSFFCSTKLTDNQEKIIKNAYDYTSTIFPEMIQEIKGIASALGLTAMDIFRYNLKSRLFYNYVNPDAANYFADKVLEVVLSFSLFQT